MIRNINNIQNLSDLREIIDGNEDVSKDYLIQALANLGQRIGLKGDSTTLNNFTFNDIYDTNYSADEYIGFIKYSVDNTNRFLFDIGIVEKDSIYNKTIKIKSLLNKDKQSKYDIDKDMYFKDKFVLSNNLIINNFEYFLPNSFMRFNDNTITTVLFGKQINNTTGVNDTVVIYEVYNLQTNRFESIYYISFLYSSYNVNNDQINWYNLVECKKSQTNDDYTVDVYTFNDSFDMNQYYINFDNNIFKNLCSSNYILANSDIAQKIIDTDVSNIISVITNKDGFFYRSFSNYIVNDINIRFANNEVGFNYDKNDTSIKIKLKKIQQYCPLDKWSLNDFIRYINNDYNFLEYDLLIYYNIQKYTQNKSVLYEKILLNIFIKIYGEYFESLSKFNNDCALYIPLDYKFFFITNNNNIFNIFYSLDNYVYITTLNNHNKNSLKSIIDNSNILIFDNTKIDENKICNYKLIFEYNKKYSDIINQIYVQKINTLPFIDSDNKWNINDMSTDVIAKGVSQQTTSFIVIINDGKNVYSLNNELNNDYQINIDLYGYSKYSDDDKIALLPTLNGNNYTYFSSSIVLYIDNSLDEKVSTLWSLTSKNNAYTWKLLKINDTEISVFDIIDIQYIKNQLENIISQENSKDRLLITNKSSLKNVGNDDISKINGFIIQLLTGQYYEYLHKLSINNIKETELKDIPTYSNNLITLIGNVNKINTLYENNDILTSIKYLDNAYDGKFKVQKYLLDVDPIYTSDVITIGESLSTGDTNVTVTYDVGKSVYDITIKGAQANPNYNTGFYNGIIENLTALIGTFDYTIESNGDNSYKIKAISTTTKDIANFNVSTYNDYTFDFDVPILDTKEVIIQDFTLLNRLNLLTLDRFGKAYAAYLGTKADQENDKNILYLTSSNRNINMGINTLSLDPSKFLNKIDELDIVFDKVVLGTFTSNAISIYDEDENVCINEVSHKHNIITDEIDIQTNVIKTTQKSHTIYQNNSTRYLLSNSDITTITIPFLSDSINFDKLYNQNNQCYLYSCISTNPYSENKPSPNSTPTSASGVEPSSEPTPASTATGQPSTIITNEIEDFNDNDYCISTNDKTYYVTPLHIFDLIEQSAKLNQLFIPITTNVLLPTIGQKHYPQTNENVTNSYFTYKSINFLKGIEFFGISLTTLIRNYFNVRQEQINEIYVNDNKVYASVSVSSLVDATGNDKKEAKADDVKCVIVCSNDTSNMGLHNCTISNNREPIFCKSKMSTICIDAQQAVNCRKVTDNLVLPRRDTILLLDSEYLYLNSELHNKKTSEIESSVTDVTKNLKIYDSSTLIAELNGSINVYNKNNTFSLDKKASFGILHLMLNDKIQITQVCVSTVSLIKYNYFINIDLHKPVYVDTGGCEVTDCKRISKIVLGF